jgi:hypothetical protein
VRDRAKKKYVFSTALILTLLYVSALLPLSGFSCACDAANAAQNVEIISFSQSCCSAGACSEKAPAKPVRPVCPGDPLCATQEMCCCSSADDELFDLQTIAVKQERRSPLQEGRCAIVLPVAFIPPQAALSEQVVQPGEFRSPLSPHIATTILLL